MGLVNQTGYFRGTIVSGGLGQSSGELPQEVWMLKASEVYDAENQEYLSADDEHDEITAYLILMNHNNKENKNAGQVKKITGWDGADYRELAVMDLTDVPLSWRVEYGNGDYADQLQVAWVAEPDATPGRTVTKLTKEEVDALQAKYAPYLAKNKKAPAPVSAKTAKKTTKKTTKKAPGRPTAPKTEAPKTEAPVGKCTGDDAYNECFKIKRDDVTTEDLNERWQAIVATYGPDEAKFTEEQWFEIKTILSKAISKV